MTTLVNFLVGFATVALVVFLAGSMIESIEKCDHEQDKGNWYSTLGTVLWVVLIVIVAVALCWGIWYFCVELGGYILLQFKDLRLTGHLSRSL